MEQFEKLKDAGIDMDSLLKRLMGNASLVRVFIKKFTEDKTFAQLQAAFVSKDAKAAEMASHTLKGMCGNLSLEELYGLFTRQVNLIRSNEWAEAESMMGPITAAYEKAIANMKVWL